MSFARGVWLMLLCLNANAYTLQGASWPTPTAHFNLQSSTNTFDFAFIQAMQKWNGLSNFGFTFSGSGYSDPCGPAPDNINSYRFSTNNCGRQWNGSTIAVTTTWTVGGSVIDTDIVFRNDNISWAVYDGPLGGSVDFRRTAVHELGHALGLNHSGTSSAIMWPSITNSVISPQSDDINGLRAIYGGSGNGLPDDFFVQNSTVSATSINAGNTAVVRTDQHYSGTSNATLRPEVGYYLSTNTSFGASDVFLGSDTSELNISDLQDSEIHTIRIPSGTAQGSYYILFVADHDNQLPESNEGNNLQAVPISVTVTLRTLSTSVSGSGSITSSPAGINCPIDCSQNYNNGTLVNLFANAPPGWRLKQWGGACTGSGACSVSMTSNKNVSAEFVERVVISPVLMLLLDDD